MKFNILVTGCQYNYYDAKNIAHLLKRMGYIYVEDDNDADVIVVISCSVRQKPIDRIFGKINKWQKLSQKPKIILTGCILDEDKKKFAKKVDLITSSDNFENDISKFLKFNNSSDIRYNLPSFFPKSELKKTAYIPIMQGCDNFCTYCAVPYTRGRERSRKMSQIIREVKKELDQDNKHIILLGQNVNTYKLSNDDRNSFLKLLKEIDKLQYDFDYNFMSANPRSFSKELLAFLPKAKKWNRHLHLPLQSGNNEILKKMNRKYEVKEYLSIVRSLQRNITDLKLTTDIIVGFPGETKKQFEDTYNICKEVGFNGAYVAQYSPRPGTVAQKKYEDDVPRSAKKYRWNKLNKLINN